MDYYFADHLGSAHVVTNASGTIQDDSDFYPYGGERSYTSSSGNTRKFTGKERDSESGLDNLTARFYASTMGRFMSADDSKYGVAADPQTWNLYGYVANNPVNAVDPTGHCQSCNMQALDENSGPADDDLASSEADHDTDINYTRGCIQTADDCKGEESGTNSGDGSGDQAATNAQQKPQGQSAQSLAAQVPGDVKAAMMASVNASNSPCAAGSSCGGDTTGGFHEEGGIWGTNADGSIAVVPATPGPYSAPDDKTAHITPEDSANPRLKDNMVQLGGEWHVHPKGGGGREFGQPPSGQDKTVAGNGAALFPIHIVLGAGNSKVYFYNGSREIGHMSFKEFF